ncbi:AAA family ATPase [Mucilaginibacter sp. CSA2-8R]|uniref:AAA family ATPase n=1 Tax=Mucilaginibacter sp. CSA2-8R TaxID=3141542 RepID=UPI00315CC1E4
MKIKPKSRPYMNRLLYIYIEGLDGYEPFDLNLSHKFEMRFDGEKIAMAVKDDLYQSLLGDFVDDINVIAGSNGVGKSTLLRRLAYLLAESEDEDDELSFYALLVYQTAEKEINIFSYMDNDEPIEPILSEEMRDYKIYYQYNPPNLARRIIYYSPFLDFNLLELPTDKDDPTVFDISQTAVIMDDLENNDQIMEIQTSLVYHKLKNSRRQLTFVNAARDRFQLPFKLPQHVYIAFKRLSPDKNDISVGDNSLFDQLQAFCATHFREYPENKMPRELMAQLMFLRNLLTAYFLAINANKSQNILNHRFPKELETKLLAYNGNEPALLRDLLVEFFEQEDVFVESLFRELIDLVDEMIFDKGTRIHFRDTNNALFLGVSTDAPFVGRLTTLIDRVQNSTNARLLTEPLYKLVNFEWQNFSSGEKMFLDLFSRFYDVIGKVKTDERSLVILIDEGEMGFHPSWQIKYVRYLCDFFNELSGGHRMQLILTTHSPLVLSDFPREHVHLFKLENDRRVKMPSIGTFVQNVSALLADDFFIESALVGELARAYVERVIQMINNRDDLVGANDQGKRIEEAIDRIDDPLVRNLLYKSLTGKRND